MRTFFKGFLGLTAALGAWLAQTLGGWDAALSMMFLLMGLDLLTGLLTSAAGRSDKTRGGTFLSTAFFLGLSRKLMMLALVILAAALDRMLNTAGVSRVAVIGFYAANEGLSIVENAALLGVPFPNGVLRMMERMRETEEEDGE